MSGSVYILVGLVRFCILSFVLPLSSKKKERNIAISGLAYRFKSFQLVEIFRIFALTYLWDRPLQLIIIHYFLRSYGFKNALALLLPRSGLWPLPTSSDYQTNGHATLRYDFNPKNCMYFTQIKVNSEYAVIAG